MENVLGPTLVFWVVGFFERIVLFQRGHAAPYKHRCDDVQMAVFPLVELLEWIARHGA
jgi:hypothetical protein